MAIKSDHKPIAPDKFTVDGFLGDCLTRSANNWTLKVNDDILLSGFRRKPGIQAYIGEHIGKFLLSCIPTSFLLNSQPLKDKARYLVESLVLAQEPDGYLGTNLEGKRWYGVKDDKKFGGDLDLNADVWGGADVFDVWVHKYCVLALLTYYQYFGWEPALEAAIKATDLVIKVFGPAGRNINNSDCVVGLGSGSFLEPLMLIYQATGFSRYLDFARYMLTRWEEPDGHQLLTVLKAEGDVATIGNGKAYEMMSCFVGMVEYARATDDKSILQLVIHARDQIADAHRYVTGGMSNLEFFWRAGLFPEWTSMETCVTFTWIQLNLRLFELTGDARCIELVEESFWNQLLPALSPTGNTWSYFMSLTGPKRFFNKWLAGVKAENEAVQGAPVTCCHTNGQRGLALVPQYAYTVKNDGVLGVNLYGASHATVHLPHVGELEVEQITEFPAGDDLTLNFTPQTDETYVVQFRVPGWADEMLIDQVPVPKGNAATSLELKGKQTVHIHFEVSPRVIMCGWEGRGKCAIGYGPLIFALDKPPQGERFENLVLDLGRGDIHKNIIVNSDQGWPSIRVPARKVPTKAVFNYSDQPAVEVNLIPVLFAGLKDNPGLSEDIDGESIPFFNQEKVSNSLFPEYRVLLPFLWYPE